MEESLLYPEVCHCDERRSSQFFGHSISRWHNRIESVENGLRLVNIILHMKDSGLNYTNERVYNNGVFDECDHFTEFFTYFLSLSYIYLKKANSFFSHTFVTCHVVTCYVTVTWFIYYCHVIATLSPMNFFIFFGSTHANIQLVYMGMG